MDTDTHEASIQIERPEQKAAVQNRAHNMSHTPLGNDQRLIETDSTDFDSKIANQIPRRKTSSQNRNAFESAFVTGSMELKRNVKKEKGKGIENIIEQMTEAQFITKATQLTKETIEWSQENKETYKSKYLKLSGIESESEKKDFAIKMGKNRSVDPLVLSEILQKSISIPVNSMLQISNRALMFELLEKQKVLSLINGIHGLILFQDGVFANTYCDQLFGQIQILNSPQKVTRSFHRNG
jgi:hypothetical protein